MAPASRKVQTRDEIRCCSRTLSQIDLYVVRMKAFALEHSSRRLTTSMLSPFSKYSLARS
jgi:hypothetical protein